MPIAKLPALDRGSKDRSPDAETFNFWTTTRHDERSRHCFKMSAFSRGFFLRPQSLQNKAMSFIVPPIRSCQQRQFLSTTNLLLAAKKPRSSKPIKRTLPPTKPSLIPATPPKPTTTPQASSTYQSYESRLAQLSQPTILYQAPSHTAFMLSSYTAGGFCVSYALVTFWSSYLHAPEGLAAWIAPAYGGVCIGMIALGGYLFLGPTRIVNNITAVPKNLLNREGALSKANAESGLTIEVQLRKMFPVPFFPARKLYVRADEISLPGALAPVDPTLSPAQRREMAKREAYEMEQEREYERSHIMTAPFRHASRAFYNLFAALRRAWTREGFLKLRVKGEVYKLDVTGGWALDGGKALDRLVVVTPRGDI